VTGDRLLELQALDTELDQLSYAESHDPAIVALAASEEEYRRWEARAGAIDVELEQLGRAIEQDERADAELHAHRTRLEAQLRTVIAPREAEALMHEIATIDAKRNDLDDDELAALERLAELDDERTAHAASGETLTAALESARTTADQVRVGLAERRAAIDTRRADVRGTLDEPLLNRYDRLRSQLGVAAAPLVGTRCEGCHLDLSAGELDTVRADSAASGYTDCPNCGRLLVVAR
jgi:hypothetical protein